MVTQAGSPVEPPPSPALGSGELVQFMIHRRFTDFEELYKGMQQQVPGVLPAFPQKVLFNRFDSAVIEYRRTQLEQLLKAAAKLKLLKKSVPLIGFCQSARIPIAEDSLNSPLQEPDFNHDGEMVTTFFTPYSYTDGADDVDPKSGLFKNRINRLTPSSPFGSSPPQLPGTLPQRPDSLFATDPRASTSSVALMSDVVLSAPEESSVFSVVENGEAVLTLESYRGRHRVRCGTPEMLLQYMLGEEMDPPDEFVRAYFLTFRHFSSPEDLLVELFRFFNVTPPESATKDQLAYVDRFRHKIQERVVICCLRWVQRCPFDFYSNGMRRGLHDFVEFVSQNGSKAYEDKVASLKAELLKLKESTGVTTSEPAAQTSGNPLSIPQLLEKLTDRISKIQSRVAATLIMNPPAPERNPVLFPVLEFSAKELAEQLTIIESEIFRAIEPEELVLRLWASPQQYPLDVICQSLVSVVERFNLVSFWISSVICTEHSRPNRVKILEHLIEVAKHLRLLNNFSTLMAVIACFNSAPVQRLRKTWQDLSEESLSALHELEVLMSTETNSSNYRKAARRVMGRAPCVPYLGLYLKDLTFMNDGNSKKTQNGQINFVKSWLIFDSVGIFFCLIFLASFSSLSLSLPPDRGDPGVQESQVPPG